jgi:hypothetical protein
MTEVLVSVLGWLGFAGLAAFYWLIGSGKVLKAYVFGTIGAVAWLFVGIASYYGAVPELPSLVVMEAMVVAMNIRGIYNWRKQVKK